jgi:hypothetical protein
MSQLKKNRENFSLFHLPIPAEAYSEKINAVYFTYLFSTYYPEILIAIVVRIFLFVKGSVAGSRRGTKLSSSGLGSG